MKAIVTDTQDTHFLKQGEVIAIDNKTNRVRLKMDGTDERLWFKSLYLGRPSEEGGVILGAYDWKVEHEGDEANTDVAFRFVVALEGHGKDKAAAFARAVAEFSKSPGGIPAPINSREIRSCTLLEGGEHTDFVQAGVEYTQDITEDFRNGRL